MVNFEKSEASFIRNVVERDINIILNRMWVNTVEAHTRYLGLPMLFGRSKKLVFLQVIEKVWKKFKGWKEKVPSRAGKEVLIKSVAQAIPTYVMRCFKLLVESCKEIESILSRFWWGSTKEEKKIHWVRWSNMAKSKFTGGMGFKGIIDFNKCLLGKQYWRLLTRNSSFMQRVFKSRYFPRTSITDAKLGYTPSYAWRSILSTKDLVEVGTCWRIGNGQKVTIMKDK